MTAQSERRAWNKIQDVLRFEPDVQVIGSTRVLTVIVIDGCIRLGHSVLCLIPGEWGRRRENSIYDPLQVCTTDSPLPYIIDPLISSRLNLTDLLIWAHQSMLLHCPLVQNNSYDAFLSFNIYPVYIYYIDASKAVDRINHWCLSMKIIKRNIDVTSIRLLTFWYCQQTFFCTLG